MQAARLARSSGCALPFLVLVGCVQPSYDSQVARPTVNGFAQAQAGSPGNDVSDLTAAHQADRAAMQACLQQMRQARLAGASNDELLQMRQNCTMHANDKAGASRQRELENDPSVNGMLVRTLVAAANEEKAGNIQKAVELYKSIDKNADKLKREAARLTQTDTSSILSPFDVTTDSANTPQKNQDIMTGQALILALMRVRREIARLDEQLGSQAESASYWQASLELENAKNERTAKTEAAARRAFIESWETQIRSQHCYIHFGSFGGSSYFCNPPSNDDYTRKLLQKLDSMK